MVASSLLVNNIAVITAAAAAVINMYGCGRVGGGRMFFVRLLILTSFQGPTDNARPVVSKMSFDRYIGNWRLDVASLRVATLW